jgi:amino acid transporter
MTAYIMAMAISIAFLLISVVVANLIKYEGGSNPKDKQKRRIWFWIIGALAVITTLLIGFLVILPNISVPTMQNKFTNALFIGTGIGAVLYILLGLIISKIFKNGKVGNWF